MDYDDAFTFVPKNDGWVGKILLASLFAILLPVAGIGAIPLLGWSIAIARTVIVGEEPSLPGWTDLGTYLVDGLKAYAILLIWSIPIIALVAVTWQVGRDVRIMLVTAVFAVIVWLLFVGAFGLLAADASFREALNPTLASNVLEANMRNGAGAALFALVGAFGLAGLGALLLGVGIAVGWAFGFAMIGNLYGQVYRLSQS